MGLAGLGDLVLTCTGDLSRNRRVGTRRWRAGDALPRVLAELATSPKACARRARCARSPRIIGVDMPICEAVYRVLYEGLPPAARGARAARARARATRVRR